MTNEEIKQDFESNKIKPVIPSWDMSEEIIFDINKLNESNFKKMIRYYDSISSSPIEYLITGTFAALSGAIGKNAYLEITDSLNIYLNIWGVIIGPSTIMRKTSAINICKKEIQRISDTEYNDYKSKSFQYEKEAAEAKENKERSFNKVPPVRKYIIFPNDSTVESLSDILSYSNRGLIVHSEFGSLLTQLNRSYSGDSKQFLTAIYDVLDSWEVSRSTKKNTVLQRPYLSILGATTIDWVKENSLPSDLRTGFLARFIYSIRNRPDINKGIIPILRLKELTSRSEYYIDIREIYDYLCSFETPIILDLEPEALELHCNYDLDSYYEMLQGMGENEVSFKARLVIYCLKFAGLIALSDKRTIISLNDMQDAIQLTDYYKRNVERLLNSELNQTEYSRSEGKIFNIIEKHGGKIQHSDLLKLSNMKKKDLDEIISNLTEKDKIETLSERTNNKPAKYYKIKYKPHGCS